MRKTLKQMNLAELLDELDTAVESVEHYAQYGDHNLSEMWTERLYCVLGELSTR